MPSGYIDFENNRAVVAALKRDGEVAFNAVYRHYYRGFVCFARNMWASWKKRKKLFRTRCFGSGKTEVL